jgi:hypothetical protein
LALQGDADYRWSRLALPVTAITDDERMVTVTTRELLVHREETPPWWRTPFSAVTWRRTRYTLLALPVGVVSVPLALLGRSPATARRQRDLARRNLGLRVDEPSQRDTAGRVLAHALLGVPLHAVSLALTAYLWLLVPLNLAYPLRPGTMGSYQDAWGGPTLAGAWAVHAVGGLAILFAIPWIVRGTAALQGRLVGRLLGAGRYPDR